jgi:hypothetical protein
MDDLAEYYRKLVVKLFIVFLVLELLAAIGYFQVIYPTRLANAYIAELRQSTLSLQRQLGETAATVAAPVFYDPKRAYQASQDDLRDAEAQIKLATEELSRFRRQSESLRPLTLTGYVEVYKKAQVHQRQASNIAGQSSEILTEYARAVEYLQALGKAQYMYESKAAALNDALAAQSSAGLQFETDMAELSAMAERLRGLSPPASLKESQAATIGYLERLQEAYRGIVMGLVSPTYDQLPGHTLLLAQQTENYYATGKGAAVAALKDAKLLQDVVSLRTKTAQLLESTAK